MASGTDTAHRGYIVVVAEEWHLLPGAAGVAEGVDALVEELSASVPQVDGSSTAGPQLDDEAILRLRSALHSVTRVAHSAPSIGRTSWALIRAPGSGRVDALLTLSFPQQTTGSLGRYRAAVHRSTPDPALEQVGRSVSERQLPAGPAIVVHEFVLPTNDGGVADPAVERAVVALFPTGFDSVFEFSILTQDLALFDDAAEYLVEIAALVSGAAKSDGSATGMTAEEEGAP